ncbi:MAG: amidohydrolase family protein [Spirochaetales bacterium]|nr:amidohydrolase family protein [Spirochaetales bacterium]
MNDSFVLKGDVIFNEDSKTMKSVKGGYLVCEKGKCRGVFEKLPEEFASLEIFDYGNSLIVPGMTDLHVHAPQYTFRGVGMDLELLDWLNKYTFPEETNYFDLDYARNAYSYFAKDLQRGFTTRAVVFSTIHLDATIELMDFLEKSGVITYVGKVNMDRNGVPGLEEKSAEESYESTLQWLTKIQGRYENTKPILTPRFIPSCSDELMKKLGDLSKERKLRIQSHLSENKSEVAWVKELVPDSTSYANAYDKFGAMGSAEVPAIMAHCVYSDEEEIGIIKKHGTYVAHCPSSNMNLTSGIAPVRKFLDAGLNVGLGTDVAAGSSMNMLQEILLCIQASKMYYRLVDQSAKPLSFEEAFYIATEGGGSYFGRVGSFKKDYDFDALILDDSSMYSTRDFSVRERIERACYNDADVRIKAKYVRGKKIWG